MPTDADVHAAWPSGAVPLWSPGSALPANHDMSPAPADRLYGENPIDSAYRAIERAANSDCPHCGKPLSE